MLTVHVRVNDSATNKPTPCRVRFVDAAGTYHAPLGRLAAFGTEPGVGVGGQVMVDGRPWAYIDGSCEIRLPPGPLTVEITKGIEYRPLRREVTLAAGQISLRFTIERWIDLRGQGWFAGDVRAHELSPHAALLEGAAEGLAVVQLLARETDRGISNLLAFSGTKAALSSDECQVVVNTYNTHPTLGRVGLLDSHRPVFPLRFGGDLADDWSIADWCDQCHRKRGLVVWSAEDIGGEALAAAVLGKIDAFEICSSVGQSWVAGAEAWRGPGAAPPTGRSPSPAEYASRGVEDSTPATHEGAAGLWALLRRYYDLLGCGVRLALVGGSGKESNAVPLGWLRTYALLDSGVPPTPEAWAQAVRAGRTLVTNGPVVTLTTADEGHRLVLHAEATSPVPFDHLELIADGHPVARAPASDDGLRASLRFSLRHTPATWVAARCGGPGVFAHTTAQWTADPYRPDHPDPRPAAALLAHLDRAAAWLTTAARCDAAHRQRLLGVLADARRGLQRGPA